MGKSIDERDYGPSYTDLISLDLSDSAEVMEYPFAPTTDGSPKFQTEKEFQSEINRLKAASSKRFKDKWEEILSKYAAIDDERESDEIDLITGKITIDNGHLSSLKSHHSSNHHDNNTHNHNRYNNVNNVWALNFDSERDAQNARNREKYMAKRKQRLKRDLKARDLFYNASHHSQISPIKTSKSSSPPSNSRFGSARRSLSPDKNPSPDNILLLDPSPTKKQKLSPTKQPLEFPVDRASPLVSPRAFSDISDSEHLYTLLKHPPSSSKSEGSRTRIDSSTPVKFSLEFNHEKHQDGKDEKKVNLNTDDGAGKYQEENPFLVSPSSKSLNYKVTQSKSDVEKSDVNEVNEDDEVVDFDEQYLIVNSPFLHLTSTRSRIFGCVFDDCHYTTGNKEIFKRHLLEKHRTELYIIGYPISINEINRSKKPRITRTMIKRLSETFPLVQEVPPLPLSGDGDMFTCGLAMNNTNLNCRREFLSIQELNYHQDNYPFKCSSKIQVYVCPVLGCGFMTDEGYFSWRSHFIDMNHHTEHETRGHIVEDENKRYYEENVGDNEDEPSVSVNSTNVNSPEQKVQGEFKITTDEEKRLSSNIVREINELFEDNSDTEKLNDHCDNHTKKARELSKIETPRIDVNSSYSTPVVIKDLGDRSFEELLSENIH